MVRANFTHELHKIIIFLHQRFLSYFLLIEIYVKRKDPLHHKVTAVKYQRRHQRYENLFEHCVLSNCLLEGRGFSKFFNLTRLIFQP